MNAVDTILIAGPTASGKSALALSLAERLGGVIINADSMQVYRDLRIITARPSPGDEARAPHRLYGHVDAAENYSVGRWCADVRAALAEVRAEGQLPIVVGGTGLYFKALTQGLSVVPPTPPTIRSAVRARLEAQGAAALHAELARRDPPMAARLRPGDRMRIARALGGAGGNRPLAGRLAPRRHAGASSIRRARSRSFWLPTAPNSTAGSTLALTPCWRPARSTR